VKGGALEGMLCEFFARGSWLDVAKAWGGLCLVVVHGLFRAWLKWRLNVWYAEFYDLGGVAAEYGSGPDDEPLLHESAASVRRLLLQFTAVVMPAIFVHPLFKWATNTWVLKWRVTLVRSYLRRWRTDARIENGAQRVHEDTSRFARGILGCCVVVLDAVLTLAVFAPVLVQLGAEVRPFRAMPDAWLLASCAGVAVVGVVGSVALGWSLIALEVANQTVEATLRKKLVLLEEDPSSVSETAATRDAHAQDEYVDNVENSKGGRARTAPVPTHIISSHFRAVLRNLRENYTRLYRRFAVFSLWLGAYEQVVAVLPYAIAAPLLFSTDWDRRITLGKVTQLANAFGHVFDALNILSDRFTEVTDWLSVLRRLREWDRHLNDEPRAPPVVHALIEAGAARSTDASDASPHGTAALAAAAASSGARL
jgi:peptide/bleomycin uptake transporter